MTRTSIRIIGLDCADCAVKLENRIVSMPGVQNAQLNFAASKLTVEHTASVDVILKRIFDAGYRAEVESGKETLVSEFHISGLDCADCAAKLEKRIASLAGVQEATINFGAGKLNARHTGRVEDIINTINEAGYQAQPAGKKAATEKPFWKERKTVFTAISGVFLVAGIILSLFSVPESIVTTMFALAILSGGFYMAKSGLTGLKTFTFDMNLLMTIAVAGAAVIGEWMEGAMVVFLFAVGNALQAFSMDKTRRSIRSLMELAPDDALVKKEGREIRLPVEEIAVGDIIIVKPGEKIAMDGRVLAGSAAVNQAPITGESMPVEKMPGDTVFAGTVNGQGSLEIEVTRLVGDTTLSRIISMVEEAQAQRAPSQQFVDRFARYYTPAVILGAILVAGVPPLAMGLSFSAWFEKALILLVISCPCALVISTPVSVVSAIGSAARRGVLIKGGAYLEAAGTLDAVAFDKTGTLTSGRLQVSDVLPVNGYGREEVLAVAAALESRSEHPVGEAILNYVQTEKVDFRSDRAVNFQFYTGKGMSAELNGTVFYIGNARLFRELGIPTTAVEAGLEKLQKQGKTTVLVGNGNEVMGLIAVADRIRNTALRAVKELRAGGIKKMLMLTGDNDDTARTITRQLALDGYLSELLPEDKVLAVKRLKHDYGRVAMVGDGVNDAPALAAADIGIAMGGAGTDTALETADIALMGDDLEKLPYAVALSKRALCIIKENIAFALIIKAAFIVLTFIGKATLWMAVFADTGAALLVIANGLRLMAVKKTA